MKIPRGDIDGVVRERERFRVGGGEKEREGQGRNGSEE